jgi:integrase
VGRRQAAHRVDTVHDGYVVAPVSQARRPRTGCQAAPLAYRRRSRDGLERGADIRDIRDLLGHESVATTEIYTHVSAARRRRVVQSARRAGGHKKSFCLPGVKTQTGVTEVVKL